MGIFDNFQMPFNLLNFLPSEQELQIAKATRDAQAIEKFGSDPNPMRRVPFNIATSMGINPMLASSIPTAVDYTPVVGDISAGVDAKQAFDRGDLAMAGLLGGAAIAPFVPSGAVKGMTRQAKGLLDRVDVSVDPATVGSMGGNIKVGLKPKPLTKEQIDPLGYGKTKGLLTEPLSDLNIGYVDKGLLAPQKQISIEDMQGSLLFPLLGDQSKAGFDLVSIGGNKFAKPISQDGGFNFMRLNPEEKKIWASDTGITTRIHNAVLKHSEKTGLPVNVIYSGMGKDAIDFATFPAATLSEMLPFEKIKKKDLSDFQKKMKSEINIGSDSYKAIKDFPKLDDPNLRKFLDETTPENRKKFVRLMDTATYQNAGFPSVAQARYANTEDVLKDMPSGLTGSAVGEVDLSTLPTGNVLNPHGTYPSQVGGIYKGGMPFTVPRDVLFRDFFKSMDSQLTKSGKPLNPAMKDYTFRLNLPTQIVDQQLVDTIRRLEETGGLLR